MATVSTRFYWTLALLLTLLFALLAHLVTAQVPVSYFVTSAAPAANNTPSVLHRLQPNGQLATVGTVTEAGNGLVINGLGYDSADPYNVYGLEVNDNGTITPPTLYKISMATAEATALGTLTPPPTPRTTFPNLGLSFILPQLGDGAPGSRYFLGGATVRYNLFTGAVTDVKFYVGLVSLTGSTATIPTWKLVTMADAPTQTLLSTYINHMASVIADGGPLPTDGIQDWVLDPASGNLISYLGQEQRFLRITAPATAPVALATAPATPLPAPTTLGYMYRDGNNRVYGMSNDNGTIYEFDRSTGSYLSTVGISGLGATQGDAATGPGVPLGQPLPVTLTAFEAQAATGAVQLHWATTTEDKVSRFEVQRSADGRSSWQPAGTLPAANASGREYRLRDTAPLPGQSYYRLAIIDRDGSVAYSPVRTVRYTAAPAALSAEAYPNPCQGSFTLALSATAPAGSQAVLRDHLGRTLWQADLSNQQQVAATLPELPAGVYFLSTTTGGAATAQRLVVQ